MKYILIGQLCTYSHIYLIVVDVLRNIVYLYHEHTHIY